MFGMSKLSLGIAAAGVVGSVFVGYCMYFDRKRRVDPEYKRKIRERRARIIASILPHAEQAEQEENNIGARLFLEELQKGEYLVTRGAYEQASDHFSNAVAISSDPHQVLYVMQQSLPEDVFQMVITKVHALVPDEVPETVGDSNPQRQEPAAPPALSPRSQTAPLERVD